MGSTSRTVLFVLERDLPKPLRRFLNRPRSVTTEAAELYNRLAKEGPVGGRGVVLHDLLKIRSDIETRRQAVHTTVKNRTFPEAYFTRFQTN
jgi:hypothetical protein